MRGGGWKHSCGGGGENDEDGGEGKGCRWDLEEELGEGCGGRGRRHEWCVGGGGEVK